LDVEAWEAAQVPETLGVPYTGKKMREALLLGLLMATEAAGQEPRLHWNHFQPPVYPRMAQLARIQGKARIEIRLEPDGKVSVVSSSGDHGLLVEAGRQAVEGSQLSCDKCDGKSGAFTIDFDFKLIARPSASPCSDNESSALLGPANHVTVSIKMPCVYRYGVVVQKVRGPRCLYLWRCAQRSHDTDTVTRP
jgi:TonB family protein